MLNKLRGSPNPSLEGDFGSIQHEQIVLKSAYFRYIQLGFDPDYDLDNWLAAEIQLFYEESEQQWSDSVETIIKKAK